MEERKLEFKAGEAPKIVTKTLEEIYNEYSEEELV